MKLDLKILQFLLILCVWSGGFLVGLGVGIEYANYTHPFEECSRMYQVQSDIAECVFIKTDG